MSETELHNQKDLLQQIAEGNKKAFEQVFDYYRHVVYTYAARISDRQSANEIVQDVFVKVWINRHTLPELNNFQAWLYTLAKNRVFDEFKRLARESKLLDDFSEGLASSDDDVALFIENKDNDRLLQQALGLLSPQQREVFRLSREQGMTYEQIAVALNISRNTVKAHMMKALESIRRYLRDHPDFSAILVLISLYGH